MKKTEFDNYLSELYYFIKNKRIEADEKLLPYTEFKYELERIKLTEQRYNIDTSINKDGILFSILNQCIAYEIHEISTTFMGFYCDVQTCNKILDEYKVELDDISHLLHKNIVKDKDYIYMLENIMKILSKMINTTEIYDKNKQDLIMDEYECSYCKCDILATTITNGVDTKTMCPNHLGCYKLEMSLSKEHSCYICGSDGATLKESRFYEKYEISLCKNHLYRFLNYDLLPYEYFKVANKLGKLTYMIGSKFYDPETGESLQPRKLDRDKEADGLRKQLNDFYKNKKEK